MIAHTISDNLSKDVVNEDDITFDDLHLNTKSNLGLQRCGFKQPSPIQLQTIPLGRCGFDLVVQSKAGTGKTCVFALIALESLIFNETKTTQSIIIAPTREIAIQIHHVIIELGHFYSDLSCVLCIGGSDLKQNKANLLNKSCQIVIGTPGRIRQLIELNFLKTLHIELLVLDEADKLMDNQFKCQIDHIIRYLPEEKQVIVTSATYPDELSKFLQKYMRVPKYIRFGQEISLEAIQELYIDCRAGNSSKKTLENKLSCLISILQRVPFKKCIVFTNFQARAPHICNYLNSDDTFTSIHGKVSYLCAELNQDQRTLRFNRFKDSDQKLLISTDVSARGIDIEAIELVINLDLPLDNATYYHRIGRAGRFGRPGTAISIVSSENTDKVLFKKHVNSDKITKLTLEAT